MNNDITTIHNGLLNLPGNMASYSRFPVNGYIKKEYKWEYTADKNGKCGIKSIWVPNEKTFLELLRFWNMCSFGDWNYSDNSTFPPNPEESGLKKSLRELSNAYLKGDIVDLSEFFDKVQELLKE